MTDSKEEPVKKTYISKLLITVVVAVFAVPAIWFGVRSQTFVLATTHQPESFTELYFLDPAKLPKVLQNGKSYQQKFAIVSHDDQPNVYTYQVSLSGAQSAVYPPITVTAQPGERLERSFAFTIDAKDGDITVTVTLIQKQQSIRFHAKAQGAS